MIPVDVLALFFVAAPPAGAVAPPVAVVAPPTSPTTSRYGGIPGAVRVTWVTGDVDAYTRIYVGSESAFYPYVSLAPGVTTWGSDIPANTAYSFDLTHWKGGIESVVVNVTWAGGGP